MRKLKVTGGKLIIGEVQIDMRPLPSGDEILSFRYISPHTESWWGCAAANPVIIKSLTGTDYMTLMAIWQMYAIWKEMPKPLRRLTPFKTLLFPNAQVTY